MRKGIAIMSTSLAFSLLLSTNAQSNDLDYQLCDKVGRIAELALLTRYSGKTQAEIEAELDDGGFVQHAMGIDISTVIREAFDRPYRRGDARQMAEAADFGDVYYRGCLGRRGVRVQ